MRARRLVRGSSPALAKGIHGRFRGWRTTQWTRPSPATTPERPPLVLIGAASAGVLALISGPTAAQTPMAYTAGSGIKAYGVVSLLWGLIAISLLVIAIVGILILWGTFRRHEPPGPLPISDVPPRRPQKGLGWIYVGSAISAVALFGSAVWTFVVLAAVSAPPENPGLTLHIIGHQWWWEVQYLDTSPSRTFETANEIHIPTGEPVRIELTSADVIHSFWVPQLTGKTELIPQQQNLTWLEADRPGEYRGECAEFCGLQHAHMIMSVTAEPPDQFKAWLNEQLAPAPGPKTDQQIAGQADFIQHCAVCHTVRGTPAGGRLGPDLTHLMSRKTLAAGSVPNTPGYLSAWIADPQHIKPGSFMPMLGLLPPVLTRIRAYLETLK